jgi:ankyrin repeat protein
MLHLRIVTDLIRAGADADARTKALGETPLTVAACFGTDEVAGELLVHGADVNLPRLSDAARPLDLAVAFNQPVVACLLIERGAEVRVRIRVDAQCAFGRTCCWETAVSYNLL